RLRTAALDRAGAGVLVWDVRLRQEAARPAGDRWAVLGVERTRAARARLPRRPGGAGPLDVRPGLGLAHRRADADRGGHRRAAAALRRRGEPADADRARHDPVPGADAAAADRGR